MQGFRKKCLTFYTWQDILSNLDKISDHEFDIDEKSPSSTSVNGDTINSDDEDDINKRRGPRTTIKAKQLEVLKSAFLATPKPSRHIREKLAEDTGIALILVFSCFLMDSSFPESWLFDASI